MINYHKPIVVIAGPTASGKSSLAIKVAKKINGYIINADSRQIYKELKIGTAQPIPEKTDGDTWYIDGIKHYLYGHISIQDKYNLFRYQIDVQKILDKENLIPILVGGTGLYIDSIVYNYDLSSQKNNRDYNRKDLEKLTTKELQLLIPSDVLKELNNSDRNNPIRLIRTIERGGINRNKGKRLNYVYLLLDPNIESLKSKIIQRIENMFANGLLEENKNLIENGLSYNLPALQSIGYQEFNGFFSKDKSLEQVKNDILIHTLQYARRQETWFKKNKDCIKVKNYEEAYDKISKFFNIS
jgi:tRNA dimethylallyltransferase